jgi:Tol biopolymer transport system component
MTRMTFDGKGNHVPIWSPDGVHIVFGSQDGLSWTRADGTGKPQLLIRAEGQMPLPWSFYPNGKRLAYMKANLGTGYDLWTVPMENDAAGLRAGKPEVFLQTTAEELYPAFSPDGRWLAYSSAVSGSLQVYVVTFPDKGGKWQVSSAGGSYPMWSRDGRLFFESLDNQIMVAGYKVQGDSFVPEKPQLWSEKVLANLVASSKNVDLAPDGKRVVALMPAEGGGTQHHVVFLENFFDELRRRVPVKR